jgi:multimeric flavodoxin WrbA
MKALFIVGSPRDKGCTSLIVDKVIEGFQNNSFEIVKHVLGNMEIEYCLGCKRCQTSNKCVQRDDMDIIFHDLFDSDFVIIAAPSYWGDIPGQLKVYFDRNTPLCDTNPGGTIVPEGKQGYSIAIRAGSRIEENQHIIDTIEHYFGHLGIERVNETDDILDNQEILKKAYEFGRKISSGHN